MNFSKKLALLFVCLLMFLTFIFSVILYQYYYRVFEQKTVDSVDLALTANAEKLNVLVDTIVSAVNQVHDNENAYRYGEQQNMTSLTELIMEFGTDDSEMTLYELSKELSKNREDLRRVFTAALGSVQGESNYAVLVSRWRPISKYLTFYIKDTNDIYRATEIADQVWYQEAMARNGELYWFTDPSNPNCLVLAKNLLLRDVYQNGSVIWRNIGVVRVSFRVDWLMESAVEAGVTENMASYITDETGTVLWGNSNTGACLSGQDCAEMYQALGQVHSCRYTCNGVQYLLQKNELQHGLQIISAIPYTDIQTSAREMITMIVIVMIALAGLGTISVVVLSRSLMKPIIRLSEQMKSGHLVKVDVYQERRDEIGTLYRSYNQQQEQIQELILQVQDSLEKQKRAEIHALQVQMNPHFIYNTLGAISCRALLCGEDEIAQQITALTAIIRYNVKNPDTLVPLRLEFDIIRHYEEIWLKTYEDCLQFEYSMTPGCETVQIPKLIIQPLVENAILHGSVAEGKKEEICIRAELTSDGWLRVTVENDGMPADVDRVNQYLRGIEDMEVSKDSFGLRNVYERIRHYFGGYGDLVYRINAQNHTEATVEIQMQGYTTSS